MNKLQDLSIELNTLAIFRNILNDDVIKSFQKMAASTYPLDAKEHIVRLYGDFTSNLFKKTSSLSSYIKDLVINDENFYIIGKGVNKNFDQVIEMSLKNELNILTKFASLKSDEVQFVIDYNGFLPSWTNENINLESLYKEHISNLHTRGYGIFSKYYAFILNGNKIIPIKHPDPQKLSELPGYEKERNLL